MMSTGIQGQFRGARSHLATNRFLLVLGQVFGTTTFTSRDVSNRLRLDFPNTCKRLSRMSKRPYYLLSVVRVSRPWGGYENSYTISSRGWSKIGYLQRQPAPAREHAWGNPLVPFHYLVNGKGEENDLIENFCFRFIDARLPRFTSPLDETGLLLFSFDWRVLRFELSTQNELLKTTNRALCLQCLGLIPKDVNVLQFVLNAFEKGSSGSMIILALLIRGGITQRDELVTLKKSSPVKQAKETTEQTSSPSPRAECENCSRYEKPSILEGENSSLRKKLENASYDTFRESVRLNNRYGRLVDLVVGINQCLVEVSDGVKKFEDSPITVSSMKSFVHDSLLRIGVMSYLIVSKFNRFQRDRIDG